MSTVPIVILAAGASKRMGVPKQLLAYRGRTLLGHALEAALGSTCRPVIVVLGANAEQIQPEIEGLAVQIVRNTHWAEGLSSSIRVGIEAVDTDVEAVVLALCDQPLVSSEDIEALVAAFRSTKRPIIVSQYAGTFGVPALFARSFLPELLGLVGDGGAKQVIQRNAAAVWPVPCPHGAIDVDTLEDRDANCS